jgi:hypothetical protein
MNQHEINRARARAHYKAVYEQQGAERLRSESAEKVRSEEEQLDTLSSSKTQAVAPPEQVWINLQTVIRQNWFQRIVSRIKHFWI